MEGMHVYRTNLFLYLHTKSKQKQKELSDYYVGEKNGPNKKQQDAQHI